MEGYMWLILISMLGVGILFGFVIGRSKGDVSAPKVRELEKSLHQANEEMQNYRAQVTAHFEKTATLFNQLTNDYRDVYEHLANSSNALCGAEAAKLKSLTADKNVLEAQSEKAEKDSAATGTAKAASAPPKPETETEASKAVPEAAEEAETEPPKKQAGEHGAAEADSGAMAKKGGKDGPEESAVPPMKEGDSGEAPRTIH